jgi:glycosyltransferase involved in cell wall biosynthesis
VTFVRMQSPDMFFGRTGAGWLRDLRRYPSDVCILNKGFYLMRRTWVDLGARLSTRRYVAVENHPADPLAPEHQRGTLPYRIRAAFALHWATLDEVVTISTAVRDRLRAWYGLPDGKARVLPYGIDTDFFRYDAAGRERLRATTLGLSDGAFLFGAVGRLAPEKGHDRLLPVFARVAADPAYAHVRLVLAGEGSEAAALRQQAAELGIADRVLFPGWIPDADRVAFLSALDGFVMPSRLEGQGLALLQAMACERPCVANDCGGPADILTDAAAGWLTAPEDFDAFERAMREVLSPPGRRAGGGRPSRPARTSSGTSRGRPGRPASWKVLGPFCDAPATGARDGAARSPARSLDVSFLGRCTLPDGHLRSASTASSSSRSGGGYRGTSASLARRPRWHAPRYVESHRELSAIAFAVGAKRLLDANARASDAAERTRAPSAARCCRCAWPTARV